MFHVGNRDVESIGNCEIKCKCNPQGKVKKVAHEPIQIRREFITQGKHAQPLERHNQEVEWRGSASNGPVVLIKLHRGKESHNNFIVES